MMLVRSSPLRSFVVLLAIALLVGLARPGPAEAQGFDSKATNAILIDLDSGVTLYRKADDALFEPAAMAKMMTMAVVFDALRAGQITLDQSFPVSEYAWRTGGAPSGSATMFAALKSSIPVSDLLRGAIVQAGNDACIILAEGIAGSEGAFVTRMNDKASALGLTGSVFANVTGLPDPRQKVNARDLATIAEYLIQSYPDYYRIYAEPEFTWNRIYQRNRNPLLGANLGVDGLSTGYTESSGFGLTASAVRDGHRVVLVVSGLATEKDRADEARKLLDWSSTAFERIRFFDSGARIADARVYGGAVRAVALATREPLDILLQRGTRDRVRARVIYAGPLIAPVKRDTQVGVVRVWIGDDLAVEKPVFTTADVATGTMRQRALDAVAQLLIGWL
ncbi:D-alanyl-D-alanine carboxypeptidase [Kaistia dalseonensis]|uniref:serine-type D-Ala-D-Ala carboxypeptidase n=1 Tax=Kaistia dalseonensis TaxID=410840 RepID=A0ABU0H4Y2_9HYPH|nr:D-alanyl-D-alanine carboxypeptidase family protein [Kaistia dalseonensis]MCX5493998.1 D-alanyl-D-alanine carboxypeptidase [Kaistia dalseonensis]MDQ0436574.1 D-alanyl-D-alanine carboxypeptidase (penicillin-binding protein 5/6) [Kaistia dalseonensis]